MKTEKDFQDALRDKKVPLLVLDQKWHRLFAIHGKTDAIKSLETEVNGLLAKQGQLNTSLKDLKKLKQQLMDNIVQNMNEHEDDKKDKLREKKLEEDKRLIEEINEKLEETEDALLELPKQINEKNLELMLASMEYCYGKLRQNREEAEEIDAWITQVRIDLKKNIIRKQNRDINNREIYAYMHDIFGAGILDIFDIKYEDAIEPNVQKEEDK